MIGPTKGSATIAKATLKARCRLMDCRAGVAPSWVMSSGIAAITRTTSAAPPPRKSKFAMTIRRDASGAE